MKSRVVVCARMVLGFVVLLLGAIGLTKWTFTGGVGSNQVELLVLSVAAIWLGGRVLEGRVWLR